MKIHLFRHGETDWNKVQRCQGQTMNPPIHLNETGRKQAEETAKILETKNLDIIFSSDLHRAKETAEIVASHLNLDIIYDKRLRELNFGDIQGLEPHEKEYLKEDLKKCIQGYDIPFPNGESFNQLKARVIESLQDISSNYDYKNIGIATHGGVISNLRTAITGEPYRKTANGEIFSIEYDEEQQNI